jgi:mannose-1-phosphate guanylyltransferase/mannose-6-phosphate isomerase
MVKNVIILAGGAGKRLWPASIGSRPKQFLKIDNGKSLLLSTLDRAFGLGIEGTVLIVTHADHVEAAVEECGTLDEGLRSKVVVVAEPIARNTAPALALAAARLSLDGRGGETCLVMAADHLISPFPAFKSAVETASIEADRGFIVPFGIVPRSAATGYGYIESGRAAGGGYEVLSFREKPDSRTAKEYLASGHHYWNAGLFTYRNDLFLSELGVCAPEIGDLFSSPDENWFETRVVNGVRVCLPAEKLRSVYKACPAISMDYAVMERTGKIRMVRVDFQWSDVGSWDVISDIASPPGAPVYSIGSKNNYVYSDRPVALCGVEDLIVVVANDRVLVCRRGKSELVKQAAEEDFSGN